MSDGIAATRNRVMSPKSFRVHQIERENLAEPSGGGGRPCTMESSKTTNSLDAQRQTKRTETNSSSCCMGHSTCRSPTGGHSGQRGDPCLCFIRRRGETRGSNRRGLHCRSNKRHTFLFSVSDRVEHEAAHRVSHAMHAHQKPEYKRIAIIV
jgi:hypothetical protein